MRILGKKVKIDANKAFQWFITGLIVLGLIASPLLIVVQILFN